MNLKELATPFEGDDLEWRIQRVGETKAGKIYAVIVPYVTARAIFDRLDRVVGPMNWQAELRELKIGAQAGLFGGIGIRLGDGDGWVWKWDVAEASDIEPVKGAASGAYKRAGVLWGMGRDLYGIGDVYAEISDQGTHYWKGEYKVKGVKKEGSFKWSVPTRQAPRPTPPDMGPVPRTVKTTPAPTGEPNPVPGGPPMGGTAEYQPATEKQAAFYTRLLGSHVFTETERGQMMQLLPKLDRHTIKNQIDFLKRTMDERKAKEAAGAA